MIDARCLVTVVSVFKGGLTAMVGDGVRECGKRSRRAAFIAVGVAACMD